MLQKMYELPFTFGIIYLFLYFYPIGTLSHDADQRTDFHFRIGQESKKNRLTERAQMVCDESAVSTTTWQS